MIVSPEPTQLGSFQVVVIEKDCSVSVDRTIKIGSTAFLPRGITAELSARAFPCLLALVTSGGTIPPRILTLLHIRELPRILTLNFEASFSLRRSRNLAGRH